MRTKSILAVTMAVGSLWAATSSANAAAYTFTQIDVPGSIVTSATGINNAGQVVGFFQSTNDRGFLDTGGSFTQIDVPGAFDTIANGINNAGQIVGNFSNSTGTHGFLDTGGSLTQIDVPGSSATNPTGINDAGQIVGGFDMNHGFLDTGGVFTQIDVPGPFVTIVRGINDNGEIVGSFEDSAERGHGFIATPVSAVPEPSSLALFGIGVIGLGLFHQRRRRYPR